MIAVQTVAADRDLPHQIVLRTQPGWKVGVSCNCRIRRSTKPFGILGEDGASVWEIYHSGPHDPAAGPLDRLVTGKQTAYVV